MRRLFASILAMLIVLSTLSLGDGAFADEAETSGEKLRDKGIVTGGSNGDLMLDKMLTRVEMAVLLSRLYGEEIQAQRYKQPSGFLDDHEIPIWGKSYVSYAKMKGWLVGDTKAGTFLPNGIVTGEQLATILLRILGYPTAAWGQNRSEILATTGINITVAGEIKRGEVFEVLWNAVSQPMMKGGGLTLLERIALEKGDKDEVSGRQKKPYIIWYPENIVETSFFSEGLQRVFFLEGGLTKTGYVDENGKLVIKLNLGTHPIQPNVRGEDRFSDGRAMIITGRGVGFIDRTGKIVIEPKYEEASRFNEGLAFVRDEEGWSYIDVNGKVVINRETIGGRFDIFPGGVRVVPEPMMDYLFRDGVAYYNDGERQGFINKDGALVVPISTKYHRLNRFSDGFALVINEIVGDLKFGYIDQTGKIAIDLKYAEAYDFSDGLAAVNLGTFEAPRWGFIDGTGKVVIPAKYAQVSSFREGLAAVKVSDGKGGGGFGYIDKTGNMVIEPMFQSALDFHEGFAAVEKDGRFGLINKKGAFVVPNRYGFVTNVKKGLAIVSSGGSYGVIDTKGNMVVEMKYSGIFGTIGDEKCYEIEDGQRRGLLYFEE